MKMPRWAKKWSRKASDVGDALVDEYTGPHNPLWVRASVTVVLVYVLTILILCWYWDKEPALFDVAENAQSRATAQVVGGVSNATLIGIVDTLLTKRGGYLSNDIAPPGMLMDNIPNWEYGVVIQVRDFNKALREAFSRSLSQSTEDGDLALAESRFNFDHNSWIVPATESEYREGMQYLENYLKRLSDRAQYDAQFYARADNLRYWLGTVETRLGSLSQRLSASVGQRRINTDLAGEAASQQSTNTPGELVVKTPWLELDDVFYEARGSTWALIQLLKAIEIDFDEILRKKNARVSLQQIIRELEGTQQAVFPVILNGGGLGLLANHSLVMASYISRANAAIIDLRELLAQG